MMDGETAPEEAAISGSARACAVLHSLSMSCSSLRRDVSPVPSQCARALSSAGELHITRLAGAQGVQPMIAPWARHLTHLDS
jgi:hypothetical protein